MLGRVNRPRSECTIKLRPAFNQARRNPHIETRCFVALEKGQEATTAGRQRPKKFRADILPGCLRRALFVLLRVGHKAVEKPSLLLSPCFQRLPIATTVRKPSGGSAIVWKYANGG